MKDKFQSLVGMRGACGWLNDPLITHLSPTNHPLKHGIGKYIFSFLLVLAMSIGNVWGELTAHTPGVYEKTTGEGGYGLTMVSYDPDGAGDSPAKNYEVYYFSWKSSKLYLAAGKSYVTDNTAYCLISNSGTSTTDGIDFGWGNVKCGSLSGSNTSPAAEWAVPNAASSTHYISLTNSTSLTLKVSGYDQFSFAGRDNHASTAGKQFVVTIDGEAQTFSHSATDQTVYRFDITTEEHTIVVTGNGTDANRLRCFSLRVPSCDDANASIIANTSVYVNDELDLEFSSDNTNSVVYDIKKGGSATSDASVTAGVFKATVAGTYVVTATQAKDASGHCAVDESVTITVNSKTPVSSVSISGDATAFIGMAKTLTASADQAVSEYKWEVDGVDQGVNAATFDFSAAVAGTYSVVCKARNSFNDPGEYISSSAHEIVVTKICGELMTYVVETGSSAIDKDFTVPAGEHNILGGSGHQKTQKNGKLGSNGHYISLQLAGGKSFAAGDVVSIYVTPESESVPATLKLSSNIDNTDFVGEATGISYAEGNYSPVEITLTKGASTLYLSRNGTFSQNPIVASIQVERSCAISDDCSIKSLTINGEAITPSAKVYSYEVAAGSSLTEVAVAYTTHPLATGVPASGFNVTVPAAGDPANTQTITVTAEDGTHSDTYTVSVSKATAASDVVTLDALGVTGYTLDPEFDAATLAYTITKAYGTEDPGTDKVTFTKTEEAQDVDVVYDGTNHKFVVTVTAEDNTTTQDYEITINEAAAKRDLLEVMFSNGAKGAINAGSKEIRVPYIGADAPTYVSATFAEWVESGATAAMNEGKLKVIGADSNYDEYTIVPVQLDVTGVVLDADITFDAVPAYIFAPYGWDSGKGVKMAKNQEQEANRRVSSGNSRIYIAVPTGVQTLQLTSGSAASRNVVIKVNGVTSSVTKTAASNEAIELAMNPAIVNFVYIENNSGSGGGDGGFIKMHLVPTPPTFSVTYMPNGGSGAEYIIDDNASEVAAGTIFTAPASSIFAGWNTQADGNGVAYAAGDAVTENLVLHAQWRPYFTITYMDGETLLDTEDVFEGESPVGIADPVKFANDFAGWTLYGSDEVIDVTALSASTTVYAKWTPFAGCTLWYPATSGAALNVGDNVDMLSGSFGANVAIVGMKTAGSSIAYDARGLLMGGGSGDIISVTLNNDMDIDTKISVTLDAKAGSRARGLYLLNGTGGSVKGGTLLGWDTPGDDVAEGEIETFSYTVEDADGLAGTNVFRLKRQNSTYIKCIKVESCGAAITYHNLTSAVNIAGKGTVTLGATSVREGYTTTATYSDIDPLYEFVNWTVSGAGASVENATANPATITVGTEDAVVTLNLRLIPVKFTVNYFDGTTPMGTELVPVNEHPTASEIATAKRHYTFLGWSLTDGGDIVALNTITRTEATTVDLFAKYEAIPCPTSGTIFSLEFDNTKTPAETVKVAKNGGTLDVADYATIFGGTAQYINDETSDKDAITMDGKFKLAATKEVMKIELGCVLQEGDIIRVPDNSNKYVISTSKTKTGTYKAQTSSDHEYAVTAAWAGVDDIYLLYDGSGWTFTEVEVYRPALLTVSFNLMGHGSAIADIENVLEGSTITAPTAPTDEDFAFAGWYKENTLENAWDFDHDAVNANTTLYAKWLDKSDATLKSLKYGTTDIELEDGIYEYEIALPSATASVPALTAVTNNPAATAVVTDDDAFDGDGKATSTVEVTPEKEGAAHLIYTVNFTKLAELPQVNVTGFTTWNFSAGGSTSLTNQSDVVLANLPGINNDENFNSQALLGSFNKMEGTYFQGSKLSFTTEVPGKLTITFRGTNGNTRHLQACVGDGETVVADWVYNSSSTSQTKTIFVPEGKVTLKAFEGETPNNARIYQMIFNATPDYTRDVTEGRYGTICLPKAGVMVGAELFEVAYYGATSQKVFLDNILSGEMEAGVPYIFLPREGVSQLAVYYTDDAVKSAKTANGLIGFIGDAADEYFYIPGGEGNYILQNNLYREVLAGAQARILSNRAYVKLSAINPSEPALTPGRRRVSMSVLSEQVTTGMENTGFESEAPRKVLINGELFIIRGEKMFDAKGQLVK